MITGRVTDAATPPNSLQGICVVAYLHGGPAVRFALATDSYGTYLISASIPPTPTT